MKMLFAVALGGAVGAVARHAVAGWVIRLIGHGFPWSTLAVNVVGSFLMGALVEAGALKLNLSQEMRALLITGALGAFTTFSTFALDVLVLWERGEFGPAGGYVVASVLLSIGALFAGMSIIRMVLA